MNPRIRIKICCISSYEEAEMAIHAGADALGLVGKMPGGPGIIGDDLIRDIASAVPPPVATFLLTSETSVDDIVAHHKRTLTNTIQMVDRLTTGTYAGLRQQLPGIKLVQVIHVMDEASVEEALTVSEQVDALLLDSGNPKLKIKELGGTGRIHNWNLSAEIVRQSSTPVFLAGGLNPHNIREALDKVQPYGVDVCSGVRSSGKLDFEKIYAFLSALNANP